MAGKHQINISGKHCSLCTHVGNVFRIVNEPVTYLKVREPPQPCGQHFTEGVLVLGKGFLPLGFQYHKPG